jgi:hypothetical protein
MIQRDDAKLITSMELPKVWEIRHIVAIGGWDAPSGAWKSRGGDREVSALIWVQAPSRLRTIAGRGELTPSPEHAEKERAWP